MGYYSNLAIDEVACHHDVSITSPEQQLLWRLDDLRDRLDELKRSGGLYGGVCSFTKSDLRYAPPGYFTTIYDIECAIELAIVDLKNKYKIEADNEVCKNDSSCFENNTGDQLSHLWQSIESSSVHCVIIPYGSKAWGRLFSLIRSRKRVPLRGMVTVP